MKLLSATARTVIFLISAAILVWFAPSSSLALDSEQLAWVQLIDRLEATPGSPETLQEVNEFLRRFPQSTRRPLAQHMLAESLFAGQDYERAQAVYKQLENAFEQPGLADSVLFRQGECYLNIGQVDQAEQCWKILAARFPNSHLLPEIEINRAGVLFQLGKYSEAKQRLQQIQNVFPSYMGSPLVRLGLARIAYAEKDPKRVLALLSGLHTPEAVYLSGMSWLALKQYSELAAMICQPGLTTFPHLNEINDYFLLKLMNENQWQSALEGIVRALGEDRVPKVRRSRLLLWRGDCLFGLKHFQGALDIYLSWIKENALAEDESRRSALYRRIAQVYYRLGDDRAAMLAFRDGVKSAGQGSGGIKSEWPKPADALREMQPRLVIFEQPPLRSASVRTLVSWLSFLTQPPVLRIQTDKPNLAFSRWEFTVASLGGSVWERQTGEAPLPEKLAWKGRNAQRWVKAGESFKYAVSLYGSGSKPLNSAQAVQKIPAMTYIEGSQGIVDLQTSVLFLEKAPAQLLPIGGHFLRETRNVLARHAPGNITLETFARDIELGKRQAQVIAHNLTTGLLLPQDSVQVRVIASDDDHIRIQFPIH